MLFKKYYSKQVDKQNNYKYFDYGNVFSFESVIF